MSIDKIKAADVRTAMARIDTEGVPRARRATKFILEHNGRRYPPKYVLSLAVEAATGTALPPGQFSGGDETNGVLRRLGFRVVSSVASAPLRAAPRRQAWPVPKRSAPSLLPDLVGRVVVRGTPAATTDEARDLLLDAVERLPGSVKFLITPGGFVTVPFARGWAGRTGWASRRDDFQTLLPDAERVLRKVITPRTLAAARPKAMVLTVGIDLFDAGVHEPHAELVAVVETQGGRVVRWTGKSYPIARQEAALVHVVDLDSHLLTIAGERVLVLGCHDLNMWSPRGWATMGLNSPRRTRCAAMRSLGEKFRPTIVLQHPHTTDTPNIWRVPWSSLVGATPSVRAWASGVAYHNWNGRPRGSLEDVLAATKSRSGCIDMVVRS